MDAGGSSPTTLPGTIERLSWAQTIEAGAARAALKREVAAVLPQLERLYLDEAMRTNDAREGIAAFLERRAPNWSDS